MSACNLNKPIYSASFIIHSESASGYDALAYSTAEGDLGLSASNDSIPQQHDDPVIVIDDSDKDVEDEVHTTNADTEDTLVSKSSSPNLMVESSKAKKIKKFDFVTEGGKHIHLTEEEINLQKKIEKEVKAKAVKHESEVRKEELVDLIGPELVNHPVGTVLNEPVLGMILFNSYHKQDFVTIKDFRDFPNTKLYIVQEIFFRLHQGPRLDDHARTFSSLLLAKTDKRNLNPLKQMRTIEKLRQ
nr:hypothetical protein [Tanacetum cinerariifolium]